MTSSVLSGTPDVRLFPTQKRMVVLSNRGPIEHHFDEKGRIAKRRSDGGVSTVLSALTGSVPSVWLAGARTEADRQVAHAGNPTNIGRGSRLRIVSAPAAAETLHNQFCNEILWFLQHSMLDQAVAAEDITQRAQDAWRLGYLPVNAAFAGAVSAELGEVETIMIHDYHLYAAPLYLRCRYRSAFLQHFIHIPWPGPEEWEKLPNSIPPAICRSLLANDSIVMQTEANVANFLATCEAFLPSLSIDYTNGVVRQRGQTTRVWANPVSVDATELQSALNSREAGAYVRELSSGSGERTILRVDRLDPIKNVDLGFDAYERLLEGHPEWLGKVRFLAFLVPSRTNLSVYSGYANRVLAQAEAINKRYGRDGWQPVQVFHEQNRLKALAAMTLYDVLLVNSLADGLNLVSKEGPVVNQRNGVLVLSRKAGSYEELGCGAIGISPRDVGATADALHAALCMAQPERRQRAEQLRRTVLAHQADDWQASLLRDTLREVPSEEAGAAALSHLIPCP